MTWRQGAVKAASVLLLIAGHSGAQQSVQEKKPVTPEAFLSVRDVEDPQFSPDSTRVAFVVAEPRTGEHRQQHVWIYDVHADTARQLTFSEKSESSPRWSPDGKTLAFLSNREGDQQQIYLLRMAGGEGVALTKEKASIGAFEWSPDGNHIAYISPDAKTEEEEKREKEKDDGKVVEKEDRQPRLRVVRLATTEIKTLTKPTWKVEELKWLPDGQSIVIKATDQPTADRLTDKIYLVGIVDGTVSTVYSPPGPVVQLRATPDGLAVGFIGSRDTGPAPHDLQIVSIHGGAPKNLTGASLDRRILGQEWVAASKGIILLYADGFRSRFTGYNREGERKDAADLPVNPGPFSVAPTGEIAFAGETATAMPELWLRDTKGVARQVTDLNESWKEFSLAALEIYKFKSFDGLEIEAGLLKPAGHDGKSKLPLVVLVHGGPTGNWRDRIEPWGQLLVARGYAVLYPNVRGSIGYGQQFTEMNRADWGGGDFKDVMAGVDDLIAKGIVDPDRLGIGGWSYGGYMAGWAVTQTQRFKAAVAGAGMSDLISEYGTEQGAQYDEWFWGVPYEKPEGFLNSSPFLYVKNAKTPTLILQGEKDSSDPVGQSQELYRGLKRYGVKTEFVLYPREPHSFQEAKHRADVQKRMVEWFDKYLKSAK